MVLWNPRTHREVPGPHSVSSPCLSEFQAPPTQPVTVPNSGMAPLCIQAQISKQASSISSSHSLTPAEYTAKSSCRFLPDSSTAPATSCPLAVGPHTAISHTVLPTRSWCGLSEKPLLPSALSQALLGLTPAAWQKMPLQQMCPRCLVWLGPAPPPTNLCP